MRCERHIHDNQEKQKSNRRSRSLHVFSWFGWRSFYVLMWRPVRSRQRTDKVKYLDRQMERKT